MKHLSQSHLFVEKMKADIEAERLVSGVVTEGEGKTLRGCWISCVLGEYDHKKMADKMKWPLALVRISENVFEGLGDMQLEQSFAVEVLSAPKPNADMSLVHWKFLHWMVSDMLEKHADEKVKKACLPALKVLLDKSQDIEVSKGAAYAAANAAASSGAHATYAAYATAYAAPYKEVGDKLLEFMADAPMTEGE